jgi:hypothetical protein
MGTTLRLKADSVDWREIEGEVIAIDKSASMYLAANRSAAVLWLQLARGSKREELATSLVRAFGIERARALADVDAFLEAWSTRGLLVTDG